MEDHEQVEQTEQIEEQTEVGHADSQEDLSTSEDDEHVVPDAQMDEVDEGAESGSS